MIPSWVNILLSSDRERLRQPFIFSQIFLVSIFHATKHYEVMPIHHFLLGKATLPVYCLVTYRRQYDLKVLMRVMTSEPSENNSRTGHHLHRSWYLGIIRNNYWLRQGQIVDLREQTALLFKIVLATKMIHLFKALIFLSEHDDSVSLFMIEFKSKFVWVT